MASQATNYNTILEIFEDGLFLIFSLFSIVLEMAVAFYVGVFILLCRNVLRAINILVVVETNRNRFLGKTKLHTSSTTFYH